MALESGPKALAGVLDQLLGEHDQMVHTLIN